MKGGTLFYRVIPADKDRGYALLTSWDKPVVQRTCYTMSSMTNPSRAAMDASLAETKRRGGAEHLVDTTELSIQKKLAKLFGEDDEPVKTDVTC